jgi:hypothetical protein
VEEQVVVGEVVSWPVRFVETMLSSNVSPHTLQSLSPANDIIKDVEVVAAAVEEDVVADERSC